MEDVERLPHFYYSCIECAKVFFYCHGSRAKGPIPARACATCKKLPKYWVHGTGTTYGKGCRCQPCREANAAKQRKHARAFKEQHGALPSQVHVSTWYTYVCGNPECRTVAQSSKPGTRYCSRSCKATVSNTERTNRSTELTVYDPEFAVFQQSVTDLMKRQWITRRTRASVYERDAYVCHICHRKCDVDAKFPDPNSATLDHAVPWSIWKRYTYVNDPLNLITSCFGCNNSRRAKWNKAAWISLMVLSGDLSVQDAREIRKRAGQRG